MLYEIYTACTPGMAKYQNAWSNPIFARYRPVEHVLTVGRWHQDLKPQNILIDDCEFKLSDFDVSEFLGSNDMEGTADTRGTRVYGKLHMPCLYRLSLT